MSTTSKPVDGASADAANTSVVTDGEKREMPAEPGATLPIPVAADSKVTEKQVEKSSATLSKLDQAVIDAEKAVADANKPKEVLALEKAKQDRDDHMAKHAEATGALSEASAAPMTVAQAKVLAVVDPSVSAGDNRAQKFGNDPANPKLAPGIAVANLVKLSRKTPDIPGDGMAYTEVPKEMVGDYERAGWNRT